ncbi:hypothetical protein HK102_002666, partial [Quaeritorhiza haematococci]
MWLTFVATIAVVFLYTLILLLITTDRIPALKVGPWQYPIENALLIVINIFVALLGVALSKLVARGVYRILVTRMMVHGVRNKYAAVHELKRITEPSVLMDSNTFGIATRTIWDRSWGLLGHEGKEGGDKKQHGVKGGKKNSTSTLGLMYLVLLLILDILVGLQTGSFISRVDSEDANAVSLGSQSFPTLNDAVFWYQILQTGSLEGGKDPDYYALALGGGTASDKGRTLYNYIKSGRKTSSGSGTLPQLQFGSVQTTSAGAYKVMEQPALMANSTAGSNAYDFITKAGHTLDLDFRFYDEVAVGRSTSSSRERQNLDPQLPIQTSVETLKAGTQDSLHMDSLLQILADVLAMGRASLTTGTRGTINDWSILSTEMQITGTLKLRREKLVVTLWGWIAFALSFLALLVILGEVLYQFSTNMQHQRRQRRQRQHKFENVSRPTTGTSPPSSNSPSSPPSNSHNLPDPSIPRTRITKRARFFSNSMMSNNVNTITSWSVMSTLANVGETAAYTDIVGVGKCESQLEEAKCLKSAFGSGGESGSAQCQADEGV